jgi:hypothetical protein
MFSLDASLLPAENLPINLTEDVSQTQ